MASLFIVGMAEQWWRCVWTALLESTTLFWRQHTQQYLGGPEKTLKRERFRFESFIYYSSSGGLSCAARGLFLSPECDIKVMMRSSRYLRHLSLPETLRC